MEKISVSIRVRPIDKQEAAKGSPWHVAVNTITLCNASGVPLAGQIFTFDSVFGSESTTLGIYNMTTKDIVASAVKGFNGTVFAYGQTSSGKTYTMRGTSDELGIIPLAVHDVFKNLEEAVDREFLLRMSYMEIYNEEINDLLAPEQIKLQVHESLERGIFVAGLREEIVASPEQVLQLMEFGEAHRHIGETNMNVYSSRSHTIFRMVIESRNRSEDVSLGPSCDAVRVSVLNLVDLAGSERLTKTGAEGARLKEGTHINKSLMTLGTVINKLSEGVATQGGHIPYRDSKLTRILQPALGGNARTAIICNITPAMDHVDESRGTLQFASRAIRVTNCVKVNEIVTDAALLRRQKKEIEELRSKLQESHSEHLEEEILHLRNTLLKMESEREKIFLELEEEKKAHAERERQQAQKIENLSTLVLNSTVDDRDFEKHLKKSTRRETWCPRVPFQNVLGEGGEILKGFTRSAKEDRLLLHNRERVFPLPPPFEMLLEENELKMKDSRQISEDLTQGRMNDDYGAQVCSRQMGSSYLDCDLESQLRYFSSKSFQQLLQEHLVGNADVLRCKLDLDAILVKVEQLKDLHDKLKLLMGESQESALSLAQGLEEILTMVEGNIYSQENTGANLAELSVHSEKQPFQSLKDTNCTLDSSIADLEREKKELALQLTEAYLQLEEEKAAWSVNEKLIIQAQEAEKKLLMEECTCLAEQVKKHILEVEMCNKTIINLEKEVSAAASIAEEEHRGRMEKSLEVMTLQARINELETCIMEERALRELESREISDLKRKLSSKEQEDYTNRILELEQKVSAAILAAEEENRISAEKSLEVANLREKLKDLEARLMEERDSRELQVKKLNELERQMSSVEFTESCIEKIADLEREICKAKSIAEDERRVRSEESLKAAILQEKLITLETSAVKDRALRELEVTEANEVKKKLLSMEDNFARLKCKEESFLEEKRHLVTENLKLHFGVDALSAKAEVFYGRLQEARDEIEHLHRTLEDSEKVQELFEQAKGELSSAQNEIKASKLELSSLRASDGHQQTLSHDKEIVENNPPSVFNSAPTIGLLARGTGLMKEDFRDYVPSLSRQMRPILFPINGNKAVENKISNSSREIALLPSVNKDIMNLKCSSRRLINLKHSKTFEPERSRMQPIKSHNNESR